jgi:azurin
MNLFPHLQVSTIFKISAALIAMFSVSPSGYATQKLALNAQIRSKISSFSENQIVVKSGEEVELTVKNDSTEAKEFRNWVLVEPGTESTVMTSAMQAGAERQWSPSSEHVLVQSKLIPPGESETLKFKAPSTPGEYPYFCTFPGHFMTMRGKLIVKSPGKANKP